LHTHSNVCTIECVFDKSVADIPSLDEGGEEATLVTAIAWLERLKAAASAKQARLTAAFVAARKQAEAAAGVPARQRGRGVAAEVALARRDSPVRGGRHVGFANALVDEMPHTLAALERGVLSEWRATIIVRESACLDVADRGALDAELCADQSALDGMGDARLAAAAKAIAYRLDPHAIVDRASRAASQRCVTLRSAPDTMAYLTALLPVEQGVAVHAALRRAADTNTDSRNRGQVMADTLVERVTGQRSAAAVPVAVNLVISDEALLGGAATPAGIVDYGPIPAEVGRQLVLNAMNDEKITATLRRLYASPTTGQLVALESRSRIFPKGLARFIGLRDQRCRTPYCDAPVRHRDHATPWRRGGTTDADSGLGLCEQCNYTKEASGWRVATSRAENGTHTAEFTTPTGGCYHSTAPPLLPGRLVIDYSETEKATLDELMNWHAA
jgi:hypothetical protein